MNSYLVLENTSTVLFEYSIVSHFCIRIKTNPNIYKNQLIKQLSSFSAKIQQSHSFRANICIINSHNPRRSGLRVIRTGISDVPLQQCFEYLL